MRVALFSNVTVEVLARMLPQHEVYLAPGFDAWQAVALNPPASLREFAPEAILLLLDPEYGQSVLPAEAADAKTNLEKAFPLAQVLAVDIGDVVAATPGGDFYDERMWKLAAMPWSASGLEALSAEIVRLLGLVETGGRKALAVDFDGILWQGVLSEDGIAGIVPKPEVQRELLKLRDRGILLVGLSKNNAAEVAEVWSDPRMALKAGDFAALAVDWRPKPENLARIARQMNLGLEAFAFVDDNPAERAEMRSRLPAVAVYDDRTPWRRIVRQCFPELRVTAADDRRSAWYADEVRRQQDRSARNFDDWLKALAIEVDVHPLRKAEIPRVAQLAQRTHQFNVAPRSRTAEEIARIARCEDAWVFTASVTDRYGYLGLVAFAIVRRRGDVAEITDWAMSCRAMNRKVELTIEAEIERRLRESGIGRLQAVFLPTTRNAPAADFFDRCGFSRVSADPLRIGYEKILTEPPRTRS